MRAAICRAFGQPLTIEEITCDPPGPGEIEVKLAACAICHSDIAFATLIPRGFALRCIDQ